MNHVPERTFHIYSMELLEIGNANFYK
jgi:hypothetical protein